jgi:hypothetical protein
VGHHGDADHHKGGHEPVGIKPDQAERLDQFAPEDGQEHAFDDRVDQVDAERHLSERMQEGEIERGVGPVAFGERGAVHGQAEQQHDHVGILVGRHRRDRQREDDPGRRVAFKAPPAVAHRHRHEGAEREIGEGAIGAPGVGFQPARERDDPGRHGEFQRHDAKPGKRGKAGLAAGPVGQDDQRQQQIAEPFRRHRPGDVVEGQRIGQAPGLQQQQIGRQRRPGITGRILGVHEPEIDRQRNDTEEQQRDEIERVEARDAAHQVAAEAAALLQEPVAVAFHDQKAGDHEEHLHQRHQPVERRAGPLVTRRRIAQEMPHHDGQRGGQSPGFENAVMHALSAGVAMKFPSVIACNTSEFPNSSAYRQRYRILFRFIRKYIVDTRYG